MEQQNEHLPNGFKSRIDLSLFSEKVSLVEQELSKKIIGQKETARLIIAAILCEGHILLEGVPGIAKTFMSKIMAQTLDTGFMRIQFTPDLMPSDIIGTDVFNPKTAEFQFRSGPIFSNIVLVDEINRSPAKTQAALFEVMEERQITVSGRRYKLGFPFIVIATQNPIEQEGTYRLPEAQIDRFFFKIKVDYPTNNEETELLKLKHEDKNHMDLESINKILNSEELKSLKDTVSSIHVEEKFFNYIANIVTGSRNHHSLFLGASPRASVAILQASKAYAALSGRDFITPDDIQYVAYPVLRHRLILTPDKEMEGITEEDIIKDLIQKVEVPR